MEYWNYNTKNCIKWRGRNCDVQHTKEKKNKDNKEDNKELDYNNSPRRFRPLGKEIGKAWRKNLTRAKSASLTRPVPDLLFDCSRVLEYAKIRTVLQSITAVHDCIHSHVGKKPPVRARAAGEGLGTQKRNVKFMKIRKLTMFITAVCVLFLIKLRWPKNKSLYDR